MDIKYEDILKNSIALTKELIAKNEELKKTLVELGNSAAKSIENLDIEQSSKHYATFSKNVKVLDVTIKELNNAVKDSENLYGKLNKETAELDKLNKELVKTETSVTEAVEENIKVNKKAVKEVEEFEKAVITLEKKKESLRKEISLYNKVMSLFRKRTTEATKATEKQQKSNKNLEKSTKNLKEEIEELNEKFKKSTIGVVVAAVVSLVAVFNSSNEGGRKLKVLMEQLSFTAGVLANRFYAATQEIYNSFKILVLEAKKAFQEFKIWRNTPIFGKPSAQDTEKIESAKKEIIKLEKEIEDLNKNKKIEILDVAFNGLKEQILKGVSAISKFSDRQKVIDTQLRIINRRLLHQIALQEQLELLRDSENISLQERILLSQRLALVNNDILAKQKKQANLNLEKSAAEINVELRKQNLKEVTTEQLKTEAILTQLQGKINDELFDKLEENVAKLIEAENNFKLKKVENLNEISTLELDLLEQRLDRSIQFNSLFVEQIREQVTAESTSLERRSILYNDYIQSYNRMQEELVETAIKSQKKVIETEIERLKIVGASQQEINKKKQEAIYIERELKRVLSINNPTVLTKELERLKLAERINTRVAEIIETSIRNATDFINLYKEFNDLLREESEIKNETFRKQEDAQLANEKRKLIEIELQGIENKTLEEKKEINKRIEKIEEDYTKKVFELSIKRKEARKLEIEEELKGITELEEVFKKEIKDNESWRRGTDFLDAKHMLDNFLTSEKQKRLTELETKHFKSKLNEEEFKEYNKLLLESFKLEIDFRKKRDLISDEEFKYIAEKGEAVIYDEKQKSDQRIIIYEKQLSKKQELLQEQADLEKEISDEVTEKEIENLKKVTEVSEEEKAKRIEQLKEMIDSSIQFFNNYYDKINEKRLQALDAELTLLQEREQQLQELSKQGNVNTEKAIIELRKREEKIQLEKEKQAKKAQKIQLILDTLQAFSSNLSSSKNSGEALAKTIASITALTSFVNALPAFKEGTNAAGIENVNSSNSFKYKKSGDDSFIARIDEGERIIPTSLNKQLNGISNKELVEKIKQNNDSMLSNSQNSVVFLQEARVRYGNKVSDTRLSNEISELKTAISQIRSTNLSYDSLNNLIVESVKQGNNTKNTKRTFKIR